MTLARSLLALLVLLTASAGCSAAVEPDVGADDSGSASAGELCTYLGSGVNSGGEVYAPCREGEAFAEKMTDLGFPDYGDNYMPEVATDTCDRLARGGGGAGLLVVDQPGPGRQPGVPGGRGRGEVPGRAGWLSPEQTSNTAVRSGSSRSFHLSNSMSRTDARPNATSGLRAGWR